METTFYDKDGQPVAYLADDGETIYLWEGHAVAYLRSDNLYGWNGDHLGWFVDGVIHDLEGFSAGFVGEKCPVATYAEPAKYAKYAKHAKSAPYAPCARSALSPVCSSTHLAALLGKGAAG